MVRHHQPMEAARRAAHAASSATLSNSLARMKSRTTSRRYRTRFCENFTNAGPRPSDRLRRNVWGLHLSISATSLVVRYSFSSLGLGLGMANSGNLLLVSREALPCSVAALPQSLPEGFPFELTPLGSIGHCALVASLRNIGPLMNKVKALTRPSDRTPLGGCAEAIAGGAIAVGTAPAVVGAVGGLYMVSAGTDRCITGGIMLWKGEQHTEERTELLLSWRHTGFSVHNRVRVEPEDQPAVERLARYIMRPPISLERVQWGGEGVVHYRAKGGHDGRTLPAGDAAEAFDPAEFVARVIMHIPRAAAAPGAVLRVVLERVAGQAPEG